MTAFSAPIAAGLAGALAVLIAAAPGRPQPSRPLPDSLADVHRSRADGPLDALGLRLARLLGVPADRTSARRLGRVALVAAVVAPLAPPAAVVLIALAWARARIASVRVRQHHDRQVTVQLPEAVDLLLLCTGAGLSLPLAHARVAALLAAPLGDALRSSAEAAAAGQPRADALVQALGPLGDRARSLAQVLCDHLRYGTPLAPGLERLGLELRLDRRRRAELEARKVPVRLLGPLVSCVLPAFALLTVVPLLAASLQSLPT
jgi:tight adherence protein C